MTKEYLKMADEFSLPVKYDTLEVYYRQHIDESFGSSEVYSEVYTAHAINSHDELVAEVERLRAELSVASDALDEVDRVISEKIKNGAYNLDDISAEVSHAIEQLSRDTN